MTSFLKYVGVFVLGAVIALLAVHNGPSFGGVYKQTANYFAQGFSAGTTNQLTADASGNFTTTGQIRSNKSTFCMDFYATSTATRVRMTASSTATIEGVDGVMVTAYGACP